MSKIITREWAFETAAEVEEREATAAGAFDAIDATQVWWDANQAWYDDLLERQFQGV